uniref:Protein kinase domain-containing protein n=1 Tax=Meloidogyne hapla TaxID=6305 RepID=A0A1I8BQW3_MELHA
MKYKKIFLILFIFISIKISLENDNDKLKRRQKKAKERKRQKLEEKFEEEKGEENKITCSCYRKRPLKLFKKNDGSEYSFEFDENGNIKGLIGAGATAKVFHAFSFEINKCVALKYFFQFSNDEYIKEINFYKIFMKKAGKQNSVQNIIHEINHNDEKFEIVMEIGGMDIREYIESKRLKSSKSLFLNEVCIQAAHIISAISNFHKIAVHMDLKPQNIIIINDKPRLADFGFSKIKSLINEKDNSNYGTFQFMSPELAKDGLRIEYATKADIWAFGVILFQMLFGFDKYPYIVMDDIFQQIIFFNRQNWTGQVDYTNVLEEIKEYRKTNDLIDELLKIIEKIHMNVLKVKKSSSHCRHC